MPSNRIPPSVPAPAPARAQPGAGQKITPIETLRGFAALYVAIGHLVLSQNLVVGPGQIAFKFGGEAVMLFFLVSGFVVMFSVMRTPDMRFGEYLWRRATRIYPVFLLALLVGYLATWRVGVDWPTLIGNIAMLQDYDQAKPGTIVSTYRNPALWSLSYEWWFYMLFWPLYRLVGERHQLATVTVASAIAALAYYWLEFQPLLFTALFPTWWWGAEIARDVVRGQEPRMGRILAAGAVTAAVLGAIALFDMLATGRVEISKHPVLELRQVTVTLLFLVPIAVFGWARVLAGLAKVPLFAALAPISYGLYALHYPVILWSAGFGLPPLAHAVLASLLALALAWFAERLWQPAVVRLLSRWRARGSGESPSVLV